jgi:hypothetical protein
MNRRELLGLFSALGLRSGRARAATSSCAREGQSSVPASLERLLGEHGARYAPNYPPDDNSDHGPMAYLALHGLGFDFPHIERFANRYRHRLVGQTPSPLVVTEASWAQQIGRQDAYAALRAFFMSRINSVGWQVTVGEYLPALVSGWVKDAFHPLIRLGYGVEFQVPSEIASGLAYLAISGGDLQLATIAKRAPGDAAGRKYLESLLSLRDESFAEGRFNTRYQRASEAAALRPVGGNPQAVLKELSRACLEVFDATHDFFALHLVTSSHAFRVCSPWAGPNWGAIYSAGIGAAYLAIGAPAFAPLARASANLPMPALSSDTDEHDIKVAYSSLAQAKAFGDPTYRWVAARYLNGAS